MASGVLEYIIVAALAVVCFILGLCVGLLKRNTDALDILKEADEFLEGAKQHRIKSQELLDEAKELFPQ